MQTSELNFSRLRNLGIFLACSALIAGCAGNHAEPTAPDSKQISATQMDKTQTNNQVAEDNATSVSSQPLNNSMQTSTNPALSKTTTQATATGDISDKTSESTTPATNTTATALEPAQTTFYFGVNQSKVSAQDKAVIAQHARFLKANPTLVLKISGHTDSTGSHTYNQYLSKRRAEAVASQLIKDGVKQSQLVIKALASDVPQTGTTDPAKNRRVDLEYDDMSMLSSK